MLKNVYAGTMLVLAALGGCRPDDAPLPLPPVTRDYLFWTDFRQSCILSLPIDRVGQPDTLFGPADGVTGPHGIAVDPANGKIYWAEYANDRIMTGNLDGSGVPTVIFGRGDGVNRPVELALDPTGGQLYWTEPRRDRIMRGNLKDFPQTQVLYDRQDGVDGTFGLALALGQKSIYWVENADNQVVRGSLDGLGTPAVLYQGKHGLQDPFGITLDTVRQHLYILDNPIRRLGVEYRMDRILRGSMQGGDSLAVLFDEENGVDNAYSLVIDQNGQHLFWLNQLEDSQIVRGSLDGGGTATEWVRLGSTGFSLTLARVRSPLLGYTVSASRIPE